MNNEDLEQMGKQSGERMRTKYHWKTVLEPLKQLIEFQ